jgi:plasmid maintenance system antidote protein VapI
MQIHANQLKFLVNAKQTLSIDVVERVCEAYYEEQKTWFAALI